MTPLTCLSSYKAGAVLTLSIYTSFAKLHRTIRGRDKVMGGTQKRSPHKTRLKPLGSDITT